MVEHRRHRHYRLRFIGFFHLLSAAFHDDTFISYRHYYATSYLLLICRLPSMPHQYHRRRFFSISIISAMPLLDADYLPLTLM